MGGTWSTWNLNSKKKITGLTFLPNVLLSGLRFHGSNPLCVISYLRWRRISLFFLGLKEKFAPWPIEPSSHTHLTHVPEDRTRPRRSAGEAQKHVDFLVLHHTATHKLYMSQIVTGRWKRSSFFFCLSSTSRWFGHVRNVKNRWGNSKVMPEGLRLIPISRAPSRHAGGGGWRVDRLGFPADDLLTLSWITGQSLWNKQAINNSLLNTIYNITPRANRTLAFLNNSRRNTFFKNTYEHDIKI